MADSAWRVTGLVLRVSSWFSVSSVLAFWHCVTHADSARRSLCPRSLFLFSGPLLLLLFYVLLVLCLGRTAAVRPAIENHGGGDCDTMIFVAVQTYFFLFRGEYDVMVCGYVR